MNQVSFRPIPGYAFGALQSSALLAFSTAGNGAASTQTALRKLSSNLPLAPAEAVIDFSRSKNSSNSRAALIV